MQYDAIIIGGGPAGATAGAILGQYGHKVLIVERGNFPRFHIGESLMPETYWTFKRIGVLDKLKGSEHVKKYSVQFYNASGTMSAPFYFDERNSHECSQTWQVVRSEFDQMMLDNAADKCCEVWQGCNVVDIISDRGEGSDEATKRRSDAVQNETHALRLTAIQNPKSKIQNPKVRGVVVEKSDGTREELLAKVVIDATGTNAMLGRRFGVREPDPKLRKASVFAHYKGAFRDPNPRDTGATLVCQVQGAAGWFWYIPLKDNIVSIGIVADIDYLIKGRGKPEQTIVEEIAKCPIVAERLQSAERVSPVHVLSDFSYNSKVAAGDGWVLIGDAFTFLDPMYSSGVFLALKSGELAADAVHAALVAGDTSAARLGAWGDDFYAGVQAIRKLVYAFYTPDFSFGKFNKMHPEFKDNLVRLLIGDVMKRDVDAIFDPMGKMVDLPTDIRLHSAEPGPATTTPAMSVAKN
ncbi:MAG: NAD(P)/FAD-dependent oxidoreductase [Phycisphaerae bacterium]